MPASIVITPSFKIITLDRRGHEARMSMANELYITWGLGQIGQG